MKKLFILMFCMLLLVGTISAVDFDDVKSYDKETKTYKLENFFGFGKHIADLELKTPQNNIVDVGYNVVAEIEIRNGEFDYDEVINGIELYDIKRGMSEITRGVDYKYKTTVRVPKYKTVCDKISSANGTKIDVNCREEENGFKNEIQWVDFTENSLIKGRTITLGVFTDVQPRDNVEWIINVYGNERLVEWASFVASNIVHTDNEGNSTNLQTYNFTGLSFGTADATRILVIGASGRGTGVGAVSSVIVSGQSATLVVTEIDSDNVATLWQVDIPTGTTGYVTVTYDIVVDNSGVGVWALFDSNGTVRDTNSSHGSPTITQKLDIVGGGSVVGYLYEANGANAIWTGLTEDFYQNVDGITRSHSGASLNFTDDKTGYLINVTIGGGNNLINGVVASWYPTFPLTPEITLNSPIEAFNSTSQTINFNGTVSSGETLANVTLFIDGVLNETNNSGINDTDYLFVKVIADGDHNWTYEACNVNGCAIATTRIFSIDAIDPFLNLTAPSGLIDFGILTVNETLNWNVSDINLDSCFYNYNFTNRTVTCGDNTTTFALTSQRNLTFFANDTFGNLVSNFTTWNYKIFENNQTFTEIVTEGSLETFSINYDVDSSVTVTIANLSYNDTQNIGTITDNGGGNFVAIESLTIPTVTTDTNVTFFWNFTFSDGSFVNATPNNQTIQDLNISDCSVNTNLLFNFSLVDEENQNLLSGSGANTSIEVDIDLSPFGSTTPIIEFSKFYNQTNPAEVCLNLPLSLTAKYRLDSTIRYQADPYSIEHYNIQNFTLENSTIPQEITLFDLLTVDTTDFRITFKDSDFVPVENALIQINRQYVAEGTFKTVEIPKTDANGQAVAHLVAKDIVYNIIIIKDGVILGTFNNVVAFCDDIVSGACFINLNALRTNPSVLDIDESLGLASAFDYNSTSRVLSYTFTVLDGSVKNVTLSSFKLDQLGNTTACFESLVSSSGVITCTVPLSIGNETITTTILVDGEPTITTFIRAGRDFDIGDAGFFILFFMVLTLALMFIESKAGVIIGVILGFITASLFGLTQGSIMGIGSSIIWLIISGAILIWKLNQESQT